MRAIFIFIVLTVFLQWNDCLSATAIVSDSGSESSNVIAVYYPEAKEPYKSIYQEIIAGGRNYASQQGTSSFELRPFVLPKNFDINVITNQLIQNNIDKVIVLGRLGYELAKKLPKNLSAVFGGLPISPNGVSGISLISDPGYLFEYLSQVAPKVKRIHIAYSKRSEWIIDLAREAAEKHHYQLDLKEVTNTKQAILFYQKIFNSKVTEQDALWLPLDRISSHDKVTLPIVLENAWAKDMVVFSSKPSHAKRGVLFSTYPDNYELGEGLYKMVVKLSKSPDHKIFAPLSSLRLAVNLRTAAHLGLKYTSEQKQTFKLTFPE